jgi:hypothetical protein
VVPNCRLHNGRRAHSASRVEGYVDDYRLPILALQQRRHVIRNLRREEGKRHNAEINGHPVLRRMPICRRTFPDEGVHVRDAKQDADVTVREALGEFDLVKIARGWIVDRRPEQFSKVWRRRIGTESLGRLFDRLQFLQNLLGELRRKPGGDHCVPRQHGQIGIAAKSLVAHVVSLSAI